MQWLAIIRMIVLLWPIIEKIIDAIDGNDNKVKARTEAIAAIVQIATKEKVT